MASPPEIPRAHLALCHLPPLAQETARALTKEGVEAFLVGGAVRDALLGRSSRDVDLLVTAPARPVARQLAEVLGGRLVELDTTRGMYRVVVRRHDGTWTVDMGWDALGVLHDLSRRDFTIDAMALPLGKLVASGRAAVLDPHGGLADLRERRLRALSLAVLQEDPLRALRGPRLVAQLGLRLDPETEAWIRQVAPLVDRVAKERVREELLRLLDEAGATASLRLLDRLGLLARLFPELERGRGVSQPPEHHFDVLDHGLETPGQLERLLAEPDGDPVPLSVPHREEMAGYFAQEAAGGHPRLSLVKLACLLHDVGKPYTRTVEPSGRIRFLEHAVVGAAIADDALRRLRFGRRERELVAGMVRYHLRPTQMAPRGELPTPRAIYRYFRDVGPVAKDVLYLCMADYLAARGPRLDLQDWRRHCRLVAHILEQGRVQRGPEGPPKLLTGHDIMRAFSLEPGPLIGHLLEIAREAQAEGLVTTKEEALSLLKSRLAAQGDNNRERE